MATERINIIVQERGTRVVKRRVAEIGGVATKSAAGVNLLRSALIGLGGALVLTSTIRQIASFEQAMSTVRAVSGATETQFKSLTEVARELGATTRFTATQAAEGLVALARAGFQVDEQLLSVRQTLLLAQAGALDLGQAAEITVSTLRGFRLEADQAGRVADVLAFAANDATTDVADLGEAMKFVAPVAAGLNVTLEEVTASLEALADAGLRGAMGGTGLRRVLAELESPGGKTRKVLKNLGIEVDEVRITSVGLTNALIRMRDAGIDTGLALELFGQRGGPAFEVLKNSVPRIEEARKELENAGGTAARVAAIMDDNLNGALKRVKSAWEAVQLSFGEIGASSILVASLDMVADVLRFLAENIEIVNGALTALAIIAIPKLVAALITLAPLLATVATGAAIGALVAFRHEINATENGVASLGDVASATWERIREGAGTMLKALQDIAPSFEGAFSEAFSGLDTSLEGILKGTARFLDLWVGFWRAAINAIVAVWKGLGPALKDELIQIMNDIIATFEEGIKAIINAVARLGQKIPGSIGDSFAELGRGEILPRLENTAAGASERLSVAVVEGFAKGFEEIDVFEKSVNDIFDRADEIAQNRLAQTQAISTEAGIPGPSAAPAGGGAPTPQGQNLAFNQSLVNIEREINLLRMTNSERELQNALLKEEDRLRAMGTELSDEQRMQLEAELQRLQLVKQVSQALDEVRGAEINLAAAQEELNRQVAEGNITLQEANEAFGLLRDQVNETATSIDAGFQRGLSSIWKEINDFAGQTEKTLVNAFQSAEDALVKFVQTGKFDFKSLVDSMLGDLTRLLARKALVSAVSAIGGGDGGLAGLFGGGKQAGGDVEPGRVFLTGESGPELFTPSVPGQIISNEKVAKAVGAGQDKKEQVPGDVVIINVSSREEALAAMGSAEGKRIILNVQGQGRRELE